MQPRTKIKDHVSLAPEFSKEQRTARDLVKTIRKLRWIGMDKEAEEMELKLRQREPQDVGLSQPAETD